MAKIFQLILIQPLFNALILLTVWIPGHSVGWAIIVLTLLIRLILVPSTAHQLRQQHKMKLLQPELQKLQEIHKDDRETQAREVMALYKKYDIHPLGSCLPMLIQLPVLIALFYVFRNGLSTAHFDLLYSFVPHPETINTLFLGVELAKPNIAFAVTSGVAQFWSSWLLLKGPQVHQPENDTARMMNLQLLYMMPIVTVLVSISLPAALPLYWVVTTLFGLAQQTWLFRHLPKPDIIALPASPLSKPEMARTPDDLEQRAGVTLRVRRKGDRHESARPYPSTENGD